MKYANKEYLITAAGMLFFTAFLFWLTKEALFLWTGGVLLIWLLIPSAGMPLVLFWKAFSDRISLFVNGLLLVVLFFLALTPLALLRRFFTLWNKRQTPSSTSFYKKNEKRYVKEDLEKLW
jgi:hypothetical protein